MARQLEPAPLVLEPMKVPSGPAFPTGLWEDLDSTRDNLNSLRDILKTGSGSRRSRFGHALRVELVVLTEHLHFIYGKEPPTPEETERLRISVTEAIVYIEAWAERHGMDALDTDQEDAAARQGWPDETGKGWTPPWDILRMKQPDYWGTPAQAT